MEDSNNNKWFDSDMVFYRPNKLKKCQYVKNCAVPHRSNQLKEICKANGIFMFWFLKQILRDHLYLCLLQNIINKIRFSRYKFEIYFHIIRKKLTPLQIIITQLFPLIKNDILCLAHRISYMYNHYRVMEFSRMECD